MVYQSLKELLRRGERTDLERPVGQVVKTEASHAFNIGSNPVRVTKCSLTEQNEGARIK